jgi:threonine synthase
VSESGGEFNSVTDEEILSAQRLLASLGGIFAEPASCAPLAGLVKLKEQNRLPKGIRVVMVLTGNGLKDPDSAMTQVGRPVEIGDSLNDLLGVMSGVPR